MNTTSSLVLRNARLEDLTRFGYAGRQAIQHRILPRDGSVSTPLRELWTPCMRILAMI